MGTSRNETHERRPEMTRQPKGGGENRKIGEHWVKDSHGGPVPDWKERQGGRRGATMSRLTRKERPKRKGHGR